MHASIPSVSISREPYVEVQRSASLGGLEIWSFFNWMRSSSNCTPGLTLSTAASRSVARIQARCAGRQQTGDASCLLVTLPEDVVVVQRLEGNQPSPGERTIVGIAIPPYITEGMRGHQWQAGVLRSPSHVDLGCELRQVVAVLEAGEAPRCYGEERLMSLAARITGDLDATRTQGFPGCSRSVALGREYIHAHHAEPLSLESMASAVGVSKWHLTRAFRKQLGLSPGEYTRVLRAQRALALVRSGVSPIVAAACSGYSDQAHMTREFRSLAGITPAKYGLRVKRLPGD